jgi:hypothetical protein
MLGEEVARYCDEGLRVTPIIYLSICAFVGCVAGRATSHLKGAHDRKAFGLKSWLIWGCLVFGILAFVRIVGPSLKFMDDVLAFAGLGVLVAAYVGGFL